MSKYRLKILLSVFFLLILAPNESQADDNVKSIVIFISYNTNLPAFQNILNGLKSSLSKNYDEPVNLIIENLEIGRTDNQDFLKELIEQYNAKFKEYKIDLFITIGRGINAILLKYGDNILKTMPRISIDLDIPGRVTLQDMQVKTGVELMVDYTISKTLTNAFALFPATKNVYVIGGTSKLDMYFTSIVIKGKIEFDPSYRFTFISGITMDSIIRFVRKLPANSLILFTTYLKGAGNIPFSTTDALRIISSNSNVPVFNINDVFNANEREKKKK
jgi:hypothetical protein